MRIYRTPAARAAIRTWCERRLDRCPLPGGLLEGRRSTPTSLLAGREDRFFPPGPLGQRARRWLLDDVRTVDGCGHLLPNEAPASLADAVTALDAHARGGSAT